MELLDRLNEIWRGTDYPLLIHGNNALRFSHIFSQNLIDLSFISAGDVVALIGDFDAFSVLTLLRLIDLGAIIVPLTLATAREHEYFFESALVDVIIKDEIAQRRVHQKSHELIEVLRSKKHAGLVLFTTGTTGRPKAILHDLTLFLKRFETPRPTLRTLNFLLFDHIGGINTLFHTLFNRGTIIAPLTRTVDSILQTCHQHEVEVLPTTPTFLRMLLMSGDIPNKVSSYLKVITYGTERMDQITLSELCRLLPSVDFRQTFGMSELGIMRVKSESRDSLFMKIGGEEVETKVVDNVLHIRSPWRMMGYLNADSPFDAENWYDTKDVVAVKNEYYKITGRISDMINVGGLKFMASEVERAVLDYPDVILAKAYSRQNPITGQHVELIVQPAKESSFSRDSLMNHLKSTLQPHMLPKRIRIETIHVGHRFKKA